MSAKYMKLPTKEEIPVLIPKQEEWACVDELRVAAADRHAIKKAISYRYSQWNHRKVNTDLLQAIYEGNEPIVQKCLQQKGSPNTICRSLKFTALHLAVSGHSEAIVSMLLDKGADPEQVDGQGLNALHYAAWYGRAEHMRRILDALSTPDFVNRKAAMGLEVPDENLKDAHYHTCDSFDVQFPQDVRPQCTALHLACQNVSWLCVDLLLKRGAKPTIQNAQGFSAVDVIGEHITTYNENAADSFEKIVERMTSCVQEQPTRGDYRYNSPLHAAVTLHCLPAIRHLTKIKFNCKLLNSDGETPIHLAIKNRALDPFETLIKDVSDISDIKNAKGFSPYQTAVEMEWMPAIEPLLDANANILEIASDGTTILHLLSRNGNFDLLKVFYEPQFDKILNEKNDIGETPLFCAISSKSLECVEFLIERDADVNLKMKGNLNVLHCAVKWGSAEILKVLLKKTNERIIDDLDEKEGMSALHMAAIGNHVDCVRALMYECDLERRTANSSHGGGTALHLAAEDGRHEILSVLLLHMQDTQPHLDTVNALDYEGRTPLHRAILQSHRHCIEQLLHYGADLAASCDHESALDLILKNVPRPTKFLESIFDKYIRIINEKPVTDPKCDIEVDFRIFDPRKGHFKQMPVLSNLFSTCNMLRHTELLFHPLVECFLYLKWKKLRIFFGMLLFLYMMYIFLLIWYILSVYYNNGERNYLISKTSTVRYILFVSMITITVPEIILWLDRKRSYKFTLEKILKWSSIILVTVIIIMPGPEEPNTWKHHLATVTVLVSTVKALFLIANLPNWGHYVQMFLKVSKNIVKVMLVFSFLIIGFTISFMIEFQNKRPFSGPFKAFVKTVAMMTSELDFSGLFRTVDEDSLDTIPTMLVFLMFVIFASIAAMNLMVGLAVSDIHSLESIGRIQRHMQQIEFLSILESSTFAKLLPPRIKKILRSTKRVDTRLVVQTSQHRSGSRHIPQRLKENIMDIADKNSKLESIVTLDEILEKLDMLVKLVQEKNQL